MLAMFLLIRVFFQAMEADLICLSMLEQKLGLVLNIEERAIKLNEMSRHQSK
jgi:hypothetical protein